jgi:hypothetical protein
MKFVKAESPPEAVWIDPVLQTEVKAEDYYASPQ